MSALLRACTLMAFTIGIVACSEQSTPTAEDQPSVTATQPVSDRAQLIQQTTASVDGARIIDGEAGNWLSTGRTYDEQRHSPLSQINTETIGDLGLEWYWDTGTKRGLEATPIVVDGVMFTSGTWSVVWAHDAKTGELLWEYDPEVPRSWARYACCDVVNRGVAAWKGKIYIGTIDGRLIALDGRSLS